MTPIDDGKCFACGPDNPIGLHLQFAPEDYGVSARITLGDQFQGWRGIAHGGIAMSLLDEAMAHAAGHSGYRGVTASVNVRFRKPVPLGIPLVLEGRVTWMRRTVLGVDALLKTVDGVTLAQADGRFVAQGRIEDARDRRNPEAAVADG